MKIQIAGPGCPRCEATERNVFNACAELDLPADVSSSATLFRNAVFEAYDPLALNAQHGLTEGVYFTRGMDTETLGMELSLRRPLTRRVGGFAAYTLSRSTVHPRGYTGQRRTFLTSYDRTHVLQFGLSSDLGSGWRAGTRSVFYTGSPAFPTISRPDGPRLRPFYRLDARLEKRWRFGATGWIAFVLEGTNLTFAREQVVAQKCDQNVGRPRWDLCPPEEIGPVTIPSIGVEAGF